MIMRIRLLIDILASDRDITELQGLLGEQPLAVVLVNGMAIDGRFMGAQQVPSEKEEQDANVR